MAKRQPVIPSKHFLATFMCSFSEDPVFSLLKNEGEEEVNASEEKTGFAAALAALKQQLYEAVIPGCCDEINSDSVIASLRKSCGIS